jgi:hypothetical protein
VAKIIVLSAKARTALHKPNDFNVFSIVDFPQAFLSNPNAENLLSRFDAEPHLPVYSFLLPLSSPGRFVATHWNAGQSVAPLRRLSHAETWAEPTPRPKDMRTANALKNIAPEF